MGASLGSLLLGKTVILPSTRVDPAQFPEADFPVFCPQCRYELRGLAEPRCPECGSPFDRGQLLVQQYVLTPAPSNWRTAARWLQRLATFVILLFAARFC